MNTPPSIRCEDLRLKPGKLATRSTRDEGLAVLFTAGYGNARCQDTLEDYQEGQVLIFPPGAQAVFNPQGREATAALLLWVRPSALDALLPDGQAAALVAALFSPVPPVKRQLFSPPDFAEATQLFGLLRRELQARRPLAGRIASLLAGALVMVLARASGIRDEGGPASAIGVVEQARQLVRIRFGEELTLPGVATRLGLSPSYFGALFKKSTGTSFSDFLIKTRLEHAVTMLLDSSDLITQIAEASGFGSSAHFSYTFKKHYGMAPQEYRKAHR